VLGVLVLIIGLLQSVKVSARNRNLIMVSIIAGVLTAVLAYIITMWGFPTTFHFTPPEGINMLGTMFTNPGRAFVGLQLAGGLMVMLGLAMFGVGIAQLVKSIKTPNA
jgi:vacuolar-type H+-ATPase subunit I/STV1